MHSQLGLLVSFLLATTAPVWSAEPQPWRFLSVLPGQSEPLEAEDAQRSGYVQQEPYECGANWNQSASPKVTVGSRQQKGAGLQLLFDVDGHVSGVQISVPSGMTGINGDNETIPLPPRGLESFLWEKDKYYLAVYFKEPRLLCQAGSGRGGQLFLSNGELSPLEVPLEEDQLTNDWRRGRGRCVPGMGTHYFRALTPEQRCEDIFPLFLMYDATGKLGAFGFIFQGSVRYSYGQWFLLNSAQLRHDSPHSVLDASQLPACSGHDNFTVVGLHVYLRPQEQLRCRAIETSSSAIRDEVCVGLVLAFLLACVYRND